MSLINFFSKSRSGNVNINGKTYKGGNISVQDGVVYVDGVRQDGLEDKKIEIVVKCGVDTISSDESINIRGNVNGAVLAKGSVSCDDIEGDVSAGGSVNCDDIGGNVTAGGSISADVIRGSRI